MAQITVLLSNLSLKDWLILISLFILFICIFKIRKLKKAIRQEVQNKIIPVLALEMILAKDSLASGLFLRNESFFLARDITLEDIDLVLEDSGFKQNFILTFERIEFLRPEEKARLKFKVLDKQRQFLPEVTESIIPHLISPPFKVKIRYTNIENMRFCAEFFKKREKFLAGPIESSQ